MKMTLVSRRELVLVSAASGAIGGGLVALACIVGGRSRSAPPHQCNEAATEETKVLEWLKLCLRRVFFWRSV